MTSRAPRIAALLLVLAAPACARERGEARFAPQVADARGPSQGGYVLSDGSPPASQPLASPDAPAPAAAALPDATFREPMPSALDARSPAVTYAALEPSACKAEVKRRELPVAAVKSAQRGVALGMRITGAMNGVRLTVPPDSTKFGVLDCRLALVLDDFTKVLAGRGVVGMTIDNFYRPGAKLAGKKKDSQHAHALAIDIVSFDLADGRRLGTSGWGAAIGEVPCGPDAVMAASTAESVEARNLVCAIGRAGLFHTLLTPSFDAAHGSHFHFDIKAETTRFTVR